MIVRRTALLFLLASAAPAGGLPLHSRKLVAAVERVQPAVVKIFGVKGFRGVFGYRTGVIVHESGLVLTRNSVTLEEAPRISCHLHDGRRLTARIVREDRRTRMVLLRLEGDPGEVYPVAEPGESAGIRPGRFVLLIGNAYKVALGEERCAVNVGVVSAVTRMRMRTGMASEFDYPGPVILHDAMNNPGVYGGPLVDLDGKVIGISGTLVESRETNVQVHFAIPIDDLKEFVLDTIQRPDAPRLFRRANDRAERGPEEDVPGYHGIRVLKGGINRATPAYVDRVEPGSPAAQAGVKPDDLVLKIDRMRVKSWRSFLRMMKRYHAGQEVRLTVKRGDEVKLLVFKLTARAE